MSTTNLFVELLVTGFGAGIWVVLLILSVVGCHWLTPEILQSYPFFGICLAIVYVLGVISDRVADRIFDMLFSNPIRRKYFSKKREYQDARRLVMNESNRLADLHEYGRIRIRVVRGWAINSVMIAIMLPIFIYAQFPQEVWTARAAIGGTTGLLVLAVGCWWSWTTLCTTEYMKIKEHAEFLRESKLELVRQFQQAA